MQAAVMQGPISAAIYSDQDVINSYSSGVIKDTDGCVVGDTAAGEDLLDHAVTIIGYNTDDQDLHYWIVQNSEGTDWGEEGYFKLQMSLANEGMGVCGINYDVLMPNVNLMFGHAQAIAMITILTLALYSRMILRENKVKAKIVRNSKSQDQN